MAMRRRNGPYDVAYAERELIRLVYDGELQIDDQGRIWRVGVRYGGNLYPTERRRAEHATRDRYLEVRSMRAGIRRYAQAHRLVWQFFYGDIPQGMTINHKNGVVDDNRPSNLELMTMGEQITHSVLIGHRSMAGENNNNASIGKDTVERIRMLWRGGMQQKDIAKMVGLSKAQVSRIVRGESW